MPVVNFDNNQHEENENLRLGNLFRGVVTYAAVSSDGLNVQLVVRLPPCGLSCAP